MFPWVLCLVGLLRLLLLTSCGLFVLVVSELSVCVCDLVFCFVIGFGLGAIWLILCLMVVVVDLVVLKVVGLIGSRSIKRGVLLLG